VELVTKSSFYAFLTTFFAARERGSCSYSHLGFCILPVPNLVLHLMAPVPVLQGAWMKKFIQKLILLNLITGSYWYFFVLQFSTSLKASLLGSRYSLQSILSMPLLVGVRRSGSSASAGSMPTCTASWGPEPPLSPPGEQSSWAAGRWAPWWSSSWPPCHPGREGHVPPHPMVSPTQPPSTGTVTWQLWAAQLLYCFS